MRGRGVAAAAFVAAVASLFMNAGPAAAQTAPTLDVQPTSTTAGSFVSVSGQCPAGTGSPSIYGFLVVDSSQPRVEGIGGHLRPTANPDGTFSVPFPIPEETPAGTWRFTVSCIFTDVATPGPSLDVAVAAVSPVTFAFAADPTPAQAGAQLHVTGSGCRAEGRALDRVVVTVSRNIGDPTFPTPHIATITSTPDAAGGWDVILDVPADFPAGQAQLGVQCDDMQAQQPSWGRVLQAPIEVLAATVVPSSTTSTTEVVLARTGGRADVRLALVAVALIVVGIGTTVAARQRAESRLEVD